MRNLTATAALLLLSSLAASPVWSQVEGVKMRVDGLACPFCAYGIEKQLSAIEGVESVETDIKSGAVIVTMAPGSTLDEDAARKAVKAAGFTLRGFQGQGAGE